MLNTNHFNIFVKNLKTETEVFYDFKRALAKTECQGYLKSIFLTLNKIILQEIKNSFQGKIIRHQTNGTHQQSFDN